MTMHRTQTYYQQDAYRTRASSLILAAEPLPGGGGRIAFEGTVFYPEGGGQPADRGTLTLPDGARLAVTDVHEKDGVIWHQVDALPPAAVPGAEVTQQIDWDYCLDGTAFTSEHTKSLLQQVWVHVSGVVGVHEYWLRARVHNGVRRSSEGERRSEY